MNGILCLVGGVKGIAIMVAVVVLAALAGYFEGKEAGENKAIAEMAEVRRLELEEYQALVKKAEAVLNQSRDLQATTRKDLEQSKSLLEGNKNETILRLERRIRELTRAGSSVVLRDPGKTSTTCPAETGGTSGTPGADSADPGRLSAEATRFLLEEYARDAEITRQDLIVQYEYSRLVFNKYNEMVEKINSLNAQE